MSGTARRMNAGSWAVAIIGAITVTAPFLWILMTSFKTTIDITLGEIFFSPTLGNYGSVLSSTQSNLLLNTRNSLIIAISSTAVVLAVASLAAYSVTRLQWPPWVTKALLGWSVLFHSLPIVFLIGPWFLLFLQLQLVDSLLGLMLAHVTLNLPLTLWILVSFFQEIPGEIVEAARVDGATHGQIFRKVAWPLVIPGVVAAGALAFLMSWNEFMVALTLTSTPTATVPVGVARFAQQFQMRLGDMAAASMVSMVPALIVIFAAQRFIVKGLTLGALKS